MADIKTDDRFLALALQMQTTAREIMHERKEPWNARSILTGALAVLKFSQASERERIEAEIAIKADLGCAVHMNPVYVDAFVEAGAEYIYGQALDQAVRLLGPSHPTTAYVIAKQADRHLSQGRYWEAEKLYLEVLRITDRQPLPNAELLAQTLTSYAGLLRKMDPDGKLKRLDEAEDAERYALEIRSRLAR